MDRTSTSAAWTSSPPTGLSAGQRLHPRAASPLVERLTQAIQEYADAVAEHALCFEGHRESCADDKAIESTRRHVKELLGQLHP